MRDPDEDAWGGSQRPARRGIVATACAVCARALERETDRWFLWLPVLFAAGILTYFALVTEPDPRIAVALVLAALGVLLTVRHVPLGLALGGALLAVALDFATAKLRTEMVRAPVLAGELRHVTVTDRQERPPHAARHRHRRSAA